jgi:SAM-dependent methyltransferase
MAAAFLESLLRCSECSSELTWEGERFSCVSCGVEVRRTPTGVYQFLPESAPPAPPKKDPADQANWATWRSQNYQYLSEKLGATGDGSVLLDLGAGHRQFRDLYERHRYVGLDFKAYPGVAVVADLTRRLPLAEDAVDTVVLSNTLEHLPEPELVLSECRRVLKPGGAVLIVVPFLIRVHQTPHDFLRYTRYMIEYMLAKTGYQDVEVRELGDIFDVHDVILRDLYITLKKNVEAAKGPDEARDIRKRMLAPFRETVRKEIESLRALCGDDLGVLGDKQYPQGYGASAHK